MSCGNCGPGMTCLRCDRSTTPRLPAAIYVWLVPSEDVLDQPGSWRIRKWDTEPFPEANFTLSSAKCQRCDYPNCFCKVAPTTNAPAGMDLRQVINGHEDGDTYVKVRRTDGVSK
jgi:hypothetical protein